MERYNTWSSIVGPPIFNIHLCDMFFILDNIDIDNVDIASYADDNTPYTGANTLEIIIDKLENISSNLFQWFLKTQMKVNETKCHLLLSSNKSLTMTINNTVVKNSECEKLLGNKIDHNLNFEPHITDLCKKGNSKIHALARIAPYLNTRNKKLLMNAFFIAQFGYCPLVWMFCSR